MTPQSESTPRDRLVNQVRYFNRSTFNPFALSFAGRPRSFWSVLFHKGRRTGQAYTTPIVAARWKYRFVIPLPYGREVDWLKNVLAAGWAELVYHGKVYQIAQPEVIAWEQGAEAFPNAIQSLMRASGTNAFVRFNHCILSPDERERYSAFTAAYPFERGAWILAAIAAFLFGISRQFRRRQRRRR